MLNVVPDIVVVSVVPLSLMAKVMPPLSVAVSGEVGAVSKTVKLVKFMLTDSISGVPADGVITPLDVLMVNDMLPLVVVVAPTAAGLGSTHKLNVIVAMSVALNKLSLLVSVSAIVIVPLVEQ